MTTNITSQLSIRGFELCVYLGWPDEERMREQMVLLDIDVIFPEPPKACVTDHLDDTACYGALTSEIRDKLQHQKLHLIEHLAYVIYQLTKSQFPAQAKVNIRITKYPKIQGLTGGASFSYGDS